MTDYTIRNFRWDDLEALTGVWNATHRAMGSTMTFTPAQMRLFLEMPDVDPENDNFMVEHDGRIIAYGAAEFDDDMGQGFGECAVHPDYQNQGIGTRLLHITEERIAELMRTKAKPDVPLYTLRVAVPVDTYAIKLFCDEGYREIRTFYQMDIELDQPVYASPLPEGIVLRPFDAARDAHVVHQAHQEAFHDHWNHREAAFEEWSKMILNNPDGDHSLWLVAWEGDQIAGLAINRLYSSEQPEKAWVSVLAVRRPWRKRGLGYALLKQSFALFQSRDFKSAALGVDSSSLTNAVALYERAGMHVHQQRLVFRKMLRGSEEDIKQ